MRAKLLITFYSKKQCPIKRDKNIYIFAAIVPEMKFQKIEKDEIRLRSVPIVNAIDLKNICGNIGISLSSHLKKQFREIADKYPDAMKLPPQNNTIKEIRVRGVSPKLIDQLHNIAANSGAELVSFLNIKLKELADTSPERLKRRLDY